MTTNYTRWYRIGKVNVTNKSTAVVGTDTYWASAGLHPGDIFSIDDTKSYEVDSIIDNTHLTLKTAYTGSTANGVIYSIIRNFTSSTQAENAAQVTDLVGDMRRYIDTDMQSIHGKSAYEVAVSNGYVGTEQQWLNYLIGAGKWVELDTDTKARLASQDTKISGMQTTVNSFDDRTEVLATGGRYGTSSSDYNYHTRGAFKNSIVRGKVFNSFTEEQAAELARGNNVNNWHLRRFNDFWLGDVWRFTNIPYTYKDENNATQSATYSGWMRIVAIDYFFNTNCFRPAHLVVVPDATMFDAPMNDEATTEGGYIASKMHTVYMRRAQAIFEACFGADHVLEHSVSLSNAVTNGVVTGFVDTKVKVCLMDEVQVYGRKIHSKVKENLGEVNTLGQFPLFAVAPHFTNMSGKTWLRDVASAGNFVHVYYTGAVYTWGSAISTENGVRPYAVIG